jgi:molybdate transport system substrate-binding protein
VRYCRAIGLVLALAGAAPALAGTVTVAVASNFSRTAEDLAAAFSKATGHAVSFSAGSSGKLYAQVENGAPFDVFLSADAERPQQLEQKGFAVAGSRFTYALGRLVLWSNDPALKDCQAALKAGRFRHLSIANPKTAPYGVAALAVLARLGVPAESLGGRLVQGENIAQTLQFVATGSAQLGFVALSQLRGASAPAGTCRWEVPAEFHAPIVQQAVQLKRAEGNAAAAEFLRFLRTDAAHELIRRDGYDLAAGVTP